MEEDYLNTIVQAAYDVLEEALGTDISRQEAIRCKQIQRLHRISAIAGVTGMLEGYAVLSMPLDVVLSITAIITNEEISTLDEVGQASIIGLMDTIMQEAVGRLRDLNYGIQVNPAALFWGQGVQLSCAELEVAAFPLQMPLGTVELSLALRES
jgi:CheY-specific phosphatase CheX